MSYEEAKKRYEALGVNVEAAMDKLKHIDYHLDYRDGRKVTYITIH